MPNRMPSQRLPRAYTARGFVVYTTKSNLTIKVSKENT